MDPEEIDLSGDRGDDFDPTPDPEPEVKASEPEPEPTPEPEPEPEPTPEPIKAEEEEKPSHMIPKTRFDEAVNKERAEKDQLQARLKELEAKEQQRAMAADAEEAQAKLQEMIKEHGQLIADGELDKAAEVMSNMLSFQNEMNQRQFERMSQTTKEQAKQEVQYDAVVARLETEYPAINPESDEFDRVAVRRVQALMTGIMQMENKSPSEALQEAVETVMPKKEDPPPQTEDKSVETGMRRKEAAVNKAMEASDKQPPSTDDVGKDHDKEGGALDASAVMKMSWEEFMALPDDKLSQMRGDYLQ